MIEYESIAKTVDKAVNNAIEKLDLKREDVDIKVVDAGGFFRKAKVIIQIPDELIKKNSEVKKIEKFRKLEGKVINQKEENKENKTQEKFVEALIEENVRIIKKQRPMKKKVNLVEKLKTFLDGFFKILNINYTFEAQETPKHIKVLLEGDKLVDLIGYEGETLNALQYLLTTYCSKFVRFTRYVYLDINGFKEKRKQTLEDLANRLALKVQESGNQVELQPMNSFERKIIHTAIQSYADLESHSEGEEPNRHLIISKKIDN